MCIDWLFKNVERPMQTLSLTGLSYILLVILCVNIFLYLRLFALLPASWRCLIILYLDKDAWYLDILNPLLTNLEKKYWDLYDWSSFNLISEHIHVTVPILNLVERERETDRQNKKTKIIMFKGFTSWTCHHLHLPSQRTCWSVHSLFQSAPA